MNSTTATWEDDENNRSIQFSVGYSIENGCVEIETVTPNKVSFICPDTNNVTREIGIHTAKGSDHLVGLIRSAGKIESISNDIATSEGLHVSA